MKQPYHITAVTILLLLIGSCAKAQEPAFDSLLAKALSTDQLLPQLIESAVEYSPAVKRLQSNVDGLKENLQVSKNFIFSALNVNSSANYGTNFSALNNQQTPNPGNILTSTQTLFYNVGIGFQLPLTHLLNRKHQLKAGKAQVEMAKSEKENVAFGVKQDVIKLYHEFKLAHRLLGIAAKNKQSSQINYQMVEKDFLQGQVTVSQLSTVLEIANKSVVDFETYLNQFQQLYMQLETLTNAKLTTLLKQVK
jgi:outer membrane protein TolC